MKGSIRKLVLVTDAPQFGGAERYLVAMAQAAGRRGMEPHICWIPIPGSDTDVFARARADGLQVSYVAAEHTRTMFELSRAFIRMIERQRPDGLIINANGRRRYWLLPWLARRAGVPAVWVHQMVDGYDPRRLRPRRLGGRMEGLNWWRVPQALRHRLAATAATAVITLNAEDRERIIRWQRVPRRKIHVVPHGVDGQVFRFDHAGRRRWHEQWGINEGARTLVVGTACRLSTEKGVDLLIEAVARLRDRRIPILAVIAGQGARKESLQKLAARRGVTGLMKFVDFVDDMPAFYSALDVFVLCSRTESFGLALAEAMACARAAVATPTAGARRQIEHQVSGWQLESFEPAELADALAAFSADADLRDRLGKAGRISALRRFGIETTLDKTLFALRGVDESQIEDVHTGLISA